MGGGQSLQQFFRVRREKKSNFFSFPRPVGHETRSIHFTTGLKKKNLLEAKVIIFHSSRAKNEQLFSYSNICPKDCE